MKFSEKILYKKFWIGVCIMMVLISIASVGILLWWKYDFNLQAYRENHTFPSKMPVFILFEILKSFIISFFIMLFSFKIEKIDLVSDHNL